MSLKRVIKKTLREVVAVAGHALPHADPLAPRILCYHGVSKTPPDEWSVTPDQFSWQMETVAKKRQPVAIMDIVRWLKGGPKPLPGAVAVTFDDGFLDVYKNAAPIMARLKIPGTAFICPDLIDQKTGSADKSFTSQEPFMDWDQVRALHEAGWTIGSHALNHPPLSSLSDEESLRQIRQSRRDIEDKLGATCTIIAYPYGTPGTVSQREARYCKEAGYEAAFMNVTGLPTPENDPFLAPRTKVLGSDSRYLFNGSLDGAMDLWRKIEERG